MNKHGDEVSVGTITTLKQEAKGRKYGVLAQPAILFDDDDETVAKQSRPWEKALRAKNNYFMPSRRGSVFVDSPDSSTRSRSITDEEDYTLDEFISMSVLTSKLKEEPEKDDMDFDAMWDMVSADLSTALDFNRKQKEKIMKKRKLEIQYEKEKEQRESAQRLQLFERADIDIKASAKKENKEKLSTEFLKAIQGLFEEDPDISEDDSISEHMEGGAIVVLPRGASKTDDDFVVGESSVPKTSSRRSQSTGLKCSQSGNETSLHDDRYQPLLDKNMPRKSAGRTNRRSKSSHCLGERSRRSEILRSSSNRSRKSKANAAEIFEAELKKQQQAKVLSISNLRQEMKDRRGISLHLLEKEFAESKKQVHSKSCLCLPSGTSSSEREGSSVCSNEDEKAHKLQDRLEDGHGKKQAKTGGLGIVKRFSRRLDSGEGVSNMEDLRPSLIQQARGKLKLFSKSSM